MRRLLVALLAILTQVLPAARPASASEADEALAQEMFGLFGASRTRQSYLIDKILARGKPDAAPILIMALRFSNDDAPLITALKRITGAKGEDWSEWMLWQEANPQVGTMPGFAKLQARVLARIDPNFVQFLSGDQRHSIRLEEITWGGVIKDGIPALTNPSLVAAGSSAAKYLGPDDLVFGVVINGDVRAYPLRILDWHEMFNDVIGGVPVSLAYCTLCGSGILFETTLEGRKSPLVFGSSGFLYRSNKLMYDTETHSLWNQFTGRPVVGPLTDSKIELKTRPVVITRWADWLERHPGTKVLSLDTGHRRDYGPGAAYGSYFASPELMFPTNVDETKARQKDYVFALRSSGTEKAWPLKLFAGGAVINDRAGIVDLVLVGDAATRTVRAYRSDGKQFAKGAKPDEVTADGKIWRVTEDALVGPDSQSLARLPGHIAYWFAWSGYFGKVGEVGGAGGTSAKP